MQAQAECEEREERERVEREERERAEQGEREKLEAARVAAEKEEARKAWRAAKRAEKRKAAEEVVEGAEVVVVEGPSEEARPQKRAKTHLSVYFIQCIWSSYWWLLPIGNGPADMGPWGTIGHVTRVGSS